LLILAERLGFEPWIRLPVCLILSRRDIFWSSGRFAKLILQSFATRADCSPLLPVNLTVLQKRIIAPCVAKDAAGFARVTDSPLYRWETNEMKRLLILLAICFSCVATAQTYEDSANTSGIVKTPDCNHVTRNHGGPDAKGNYADLWWSLHSTSLVKTTRWIQKQACRAARIIVAPDGQTYAQKRNRQHFRLEGGGLFPVADFAGSTVGTPPPPPVTTPPVVVLPTPPVTGAKPLRIVVVPLHYQSPPSTTKEAIDAYNQSLPKITQAALQATFAPVAAWWTAESYGLQPMQVTVLPEVLIPGNPYCSYSMFEGDAAKAVTASGVQADVTVGVAPYSCWSSKAVGGYHRVTVWNTTADGQGMYAHEIGHAVGLLHNGSQLAGTSFAEYGSGLDQMGSGSDFYNLRHFSSDHKNKLGVLPSPKTCASATLRPIYTTPDAINCGAWWIDYAPDSGYVYVHKRETRSGGGGGSDTTDYARLLAGQWFMMDEGHTVKHVGRGVVTILSSMP
jgi:hypothetical protein